jgi:hypothetical protein
VLPSPFKDRVEAEVAFVKSEKFRRGELQNLLKMAPHVPSGRAFCATLFKILDKATSGRPRKHPCLCKGQDRVHLLKERLHLNFEFGHRAGSGWDRDSAMCRSELESIHWETQLKYMKQEYLRTSARLMTCHPCRCSIR